MLSKARTREIIQRVEALDEERGEDWPGPFKFASDRLIHLDEHRHISLVRDIPHISRRGIARSKAEAVRALQKMRTDPRSMIQLWENGEVVFWVEFSERQIRVLRYVEGDWLALLE